MHAAASWLVRGSGIEATVDGEAGLLCRTCLFWEDACGRLRGEGRQSWQEVFPEAAQQGRVAAGAVTWGASKSPSNIISSFLGLADVQKHQNGQ